MLTLAVVMALGAAPPAVLTAEQARLYRRCTLHMGVARSQWDTGRGDDAVATYREAVALMERLAGRDKREMASMLFELATWERRRGNPAASVALERATFEIEERLWGPGHWMAVDARWRWRTAERLAGLGRAKCEAFELAFQQNKDGLELMSQGKPVEALALFRAALDGFRATVGETSPYTASGYNNVGLALNARGAGREALGLYRKSLAIQAEVLGERHREYITSLRNVAGAIRKLGDDAEALRLCQQALRLSRLVSGRYSEDHATSLNNVAVLHSALDDHRAALATHAELADVIEVVFGEQDPRYATTLVNHAGVHESRGDYGKALPLLRRALALRKAHLGERHPDYAASHVSLGVALRDAGDHPAALAHLNRGVELVRRSAGVRSPAHARALGDLARLRHEMGDHSNAIPLLRQSLKIRAELFGQKHPEYADGLNSLAAVYKDTGDAAAALALMRAVVEIREAAHGHGHPAHANSLHNLGMVHLSLGDHGAARAHLGAALSLRSGRLGERHPGTMHAMHSLAKAHQEGGNLGTARLLAWRAMTDRKEILGERHPDFAASLSRYASITYMADDGEAAIPMLRRALAVREELLGGRHPTTAAAMHNLASALRDNGRAAEAAPLAGKAVALTLEHLRVNAAFQSDRQQMGGAAAVRHHLDAYLSVPGVAADEAARHVLAWKGAVLLRQQQRRLFLRLAADPAARAAAAALAETTRLIAAAAGRGGDVRELVVRQERVQADLARLSADFREARLREMPAPSDLAEALPEGAALVDYLMYTRHGRKDGALRSRPSLLAFVHRRGRPAAMVDLGEAGGPLKAIADWRAELLRRRPALVQAGEARRLLWAPLEKHIEGASLVLVSPDSLLGFVPFAALPGKKAGSYLIEDVALAVVPLPSALPGIVRPADKAGRLAPSLLAVGDLRYDPREGDAAPPAAEDSRSAPRLGRGRYARLPATAPEMAAIVDAFGRLFKSGTVTTLRDGDATKAAVRKALASVRYAHLATHGYFARAEAAPPARSRPPLDPEPPPVHPLLLSGLALSDANRVPKEGEEDGILTALEVTEMDLSKLELATLSACETGLGMLAGGEGLLGMQRAFHAAGARTVIASLWKVDDRATRQLMADFYTQAWDTRKIISRAEALRQAQLAMLKDGVKRGTVKELEAEKATRRVPPYYWAAFVLSGDWR